MQRGVAVPAGSAAGASRGWTACPGRRRPAGQRHVAPEGAVSGGPRSVLRGARKASTPQSVASWGFQSYFRAGAGHRRCWLHWLDGW
jgi:hypothetical protein